MSSYNDEIILAQLKNQKIEVLHYFS